MIHCTVVCCVDESGVAAQIAEPLADVQMPTYYISTYGLGHTLVCTNLWVIEVLWETWTEYLKLSLATTVTPGNIKLLNLPSWKQGIKTQILLMINPQDKIVEDNKAICMISLISWGIFDWFSASSILEYYQMINFVLVFRISGLSLLSNNKGACNSVAIKILELLLASFLQLLSIHPWINLKPFVCYF